MLQFFIWCDSFDSRKTTQTCLCWVCGEITYLATPSQICSNMSGCQFDRNNCCCVPLLGWCDETWKVFPFLLHVVLQCNVSAFYIVLPFRRHFIQKLIFQLFFFTNEFAMAFVWFYIGSMLPSKQVLQYFLHLHFDWKVTTNAVAAETVKLVGIFKDRGRIPVQKAEWRREKVVRLHENWKGLNKRAYSGVLCQPHKTSFLHAERNNRRIRVGSNDYTRSTVKPKRAIWMRLLNSHPALP